MKNLLLIHTGGTFGMRASGEQPPLVPGNLENDIEQYSPIINKIANIDIQIPFNLDSSDIGPDEWILLSKMISEKIDSFDGVVIIHGTDTLVFTATALSYLLTDLRKPVILTGSQRPIFEVRSDARNNLISALELASMEIPEVGICFGNRLLRGNRSRKKSIESFQSFESPNYPPLASVGMNIDIHYNNILRRRGSVRFVPGFDSKIVCLNAVPGLEPIDKNLLTDDSIRALVIRGFGAGNLPLKNTDWISLIEQATRKNILVVIGSYSSHGRVDLGLYANGRAALDAGAISMMDMTLEAALVKLMLLQANFEDVDEVKKMFLQPVAGEMTVEAESHA